MNNDIKMYLLVCIMLCKFYRPKNWNLNKSRNNNNTSSKYVPLFPTTTTPYIKILILKWTPWRRWGRQLNEFEKKCPPHPSRNLCSQYFLIFNLITLLVFCFCFSDQLLIRVFFFFFFLKLVKRTSRPNAISLHHQWKSEK